MRVFKVVYYKYKESCDGIRGKISIDYPQPRVILVTFSPPGSLGRGNHIRLYAGLPAAFHYLDDDYQADFKVDPSYE